MYPTFNRFCQWASRFRAIPVWIEPELPSRELIEWAHSLIGHQQRFFLLQSTMAGSEGRYSYLSLENPRYSIFANDREMTVRYISESGLRQEALKIGNSVDRFQGWMAGFTAPTVEALPPFWGGAVGYFGYESAACHHPSLKGLFHRKVRKPASLATEAFPELEFGFYDAVAAIDHARSKLWLVHTVLLPEHRTLSPMQLERVYRQSQDRLRRAAVRLQRALRRRRPWGTLALSDLRSNRSAASFALMVRRAKGMIAAGEIFRCHLSQNFSASWHGDPWMLYRRLVEVHPAPHGALWRSGARWIASASAELLVRVEGGRAKISGIQGVLVPGMTWRDAIRTCFPCGTMTGSPKLRTMEIIDKLEPHRRGPYAGALGWIGFNGDMALNVLNRTLFADQDRLSYPVGVSVGAESEAPHGYQTTLESAQAVFQSLLSSSTVERHHTR